MPDLVGGATRFDRAAGVAMHGPFHLSTHGDRKLYQGTGFAVERSCLGRSRPERIIGLEKSRKPPLEL